MCRSRRIYHVSEEMDTINRAAQKEADSMAILLLLQFIVYSATGWKRKDNRLYLLSVILTAVGLVIFYFAEKNLLLKVCVLAVFHVLLWMLYLLDNYLWNLRIEMDADSKRIIENRKNFCLLLNIIPLSVLVYLFANNIDSGAQTAEIVFAVIGAIMLLFCLWFRFRKNTDNSLLYYFQAGTFLFYGYAVLDIAVFYIFFVQISSRLSVNEMVLKLLIVLITAAVGISCRAYRGKMRTIENRFLEKEGIPVQEDEYPENFISIPRKYGYGFTLNLKNPVSFYLILALFCYCVLFM